MKFQRKLSNGSWVDASDRIDEFVGYAVEADKTMAPIRKRDPRTAQGILDALAAGEEVKCDLEYWYAMIRDADARKPRKVQQPDYPNGRRLSCGCTVYNAVEVMNASMGSSCANCYDQMSN